jgi:hypothetical protein
MANNSTVVRYRVLRKLNDRTGWPARARRGWLGGKQAPSQEEKLYNYEGGNNRFEARTPIHTPNKPRATLNIT